MTLQTDLAMQSRLKHPRQTSVADAAAKASALALLAFAMGQFLVGLDQSVMSVALPTIQLDFGVGMMQLEWATMAYMVAGAAVAVPFGVLGDRSGRRRLYLVGSSLFVVGSALCAFAPNMDVLIAGRAVQGIGSGAMGTLALAMLTASVTHEQIPKLIGLWTAVTAGAAAFGPLIGGVMVQLLGWRWMFGINVILMALVIPMVIRRVTDDTPAVRAAGKVGWLGSGLLTVGLILVSGGLSRLETARLSEPEVYVPLMLGALAIVVLVIQQRRTLTPMTNWAAIRTSPIPATLALSVVLGMVLAGAMMQQMILVQNVLGFSPMLAGLVSFGASALLVVFSPISPRIMARIGLGLTTMIGLEITAVGLFGLSLTTTTTGAVAVGFWFSIMGIGLGIGMPAVTAGAMSAIPKDQMGAVSGFMALTSSISAVLGITIVSALSATRVTSAWDVNGLRIPDFTALTDEVISGAIPAILKQYGAEAAREASLSFTSGVTEAMFIAGAGVAVAGVAAVFLLGSRGKVSAKAVVPEPSA